MTLSDDEPSKGVISSIADWLFKILWIFESRRNDAKVDMYRKMLWPEISGKVLDLGPGFAKSLEFLRHATATDGSYAIDSAVVHSYTALEPNPFLYSHLHKNAEKNGFCVQYDRQSYPDGKESNTVAVRDNMVPFTIVRGTLDKKSLIPQAVLDGAPYDTILTSFSMCTVKDPESTAKNIIKLLKPGGKYVFIEHVLQPDVDDPHVVEDNGVDAKFWAGVQKFINPLWKIIGHGCHINRRTGDTIASIDGWESVDYKSVRPAIDLQSRIMPLSFGIATKAKGDKEEI
ncbi:hypothetical protein GGI25_006076 [Coemansia spiralis]|uniref:Methyltransferase type 11 domain-containing protein n=2 Tax=Coemansia TaxID=4863 RepID=A0A9W8FXI8_9FUNG|nr:hypothetical protein EDC05_004694 [Coemansia umbellata]KAJ2620355.1 hypothetical protein GGI26_005064 [Coemansia sp. RSA 1358]KAJ2669651.1 hypothetical protein GGI25_006076 [Coemansia spiralis]